jgi:ADP-heptose:LPS heptosyltransferase
MNLLNLETNESLWKEEVPKREFKPVSRSVMRQLGLSKENIRHVDTIDELRKDPPNIIIAEAVRNVKFVQNWFKEQVLLKKHRYVMGLGVFQQLHYDARGTKILKPTSLRFKNIYRPYLGQNVEGKSILVFRTGGIGDLLFIQPNLRYLKETYDDCTIRFACGPQYQPMVENWDCVDEVLDLPYPSSTLIKSDYHVLFEGVIERCKEAERVNAYELFTRWLGLNLPDELLIPKQEPKKELVDECINILGEDFGLTEEDGFVVMQLRASSPIRTPRHDFWIKIINGLNKRGINVVLTDNPRQADNIQMFINMLDNPSKTFNFCKHSKSIDYTIALTSLSKGTVATDSALGHIAASLDKKCFGIYGPFPGEIRLKTYPKATWIDATRHCAPCFLHGHRPCPHATSEGYSPCYDELIDTQEKLDTVVNMIGEFIND